MENEDMTIEKCLKLVEEVRKECEIMQPKIESLELELSVYHAIGNIATCHAAVEKYKPEEVKNYNGDYGICPVCSSGVHRTDCYCSHCGKRLKWIDEKRVGVCDEK